MSPHFIPDLKHLPLYLTSIILYLQNFSKLKKNRHYIAIQGALCILYGAIRPHGEQLRIILVEYFKPRKIHPSVLLWSCQFRMLEYKDDKISKTGKKKMDRKSRSRKCFDVLENVVKLWKKKSLWSCGNGYQSSMFYRVHSGSEYTELYSFLRQFVFSCRQVGDVYVPHSSASIIAKITV
jgi:hypothetical protein